MAKPKRVVHGQPEPANQIGAALLAWRGTRTRPEAAALLGVSLKTYYTLESLGKTCRIGIAKRDAKISRTGGRNGAGPTVRSCRASAG